MKNPSRKHSDKAVVFDLGGVLIDWNPRHLYRKIFTDAIQMEWFLSNVCTQKWHEQVDAGCTPEEIEPPLLTQHPEYRQEILAFHERFVEMFGPPLDDMVRVLEALDAVDVPLFAITNWGKDTFPWAREAFPFLSRFRQIVVSGEEGITKPDPRLFNLLFQRGNIVPTNAVFIDDHEPNIRVAETLGMRAIHHRSAAATMAALAQLGFPPGDA